MIKSGITRRIDELGRIVVPKEIRYNLGIRDGEPLEIYTNDNSIIIKKYSQVENIKDLSSILCEIISDICDVSVLVTDREKVIATNKSVVNIVDTKINDKLKTLIDNRVSYFSEVAEDHLGISGFYYILPIITSTDSSGLIILVSKTKKEENIKYSKIIQKLLIQKLDI